jgi:hypothetical protein
MKSTNDDADRICISIRYTPVLLRFLLGILVLAGMWRLLFPGDKILGWLTLSCILLITISFSRYFRRSGPAVVISQKELTIRRGPGFTGDISWSSVSSVSLKRHRFDWYYVVGMVDPEKIIMSRSKFGRWFLRKTTEMFGSPVAFSSFFLKCDHAWLLERMQQFKDAAGRL